MRLGLGSRPFEKGLLKAAAPIVLQRKLVQPGLTPAGGGRGAAGLTEHNHQHRCNPVLPGWVFKLYFCFTFPVIKARTATAPPLALFALPVVLISHRLDPEPAAGPKGELQSLVQKRPASIAPSRGRRRCCRGIRAARATRKEQT